MHHRCSQTHGAYHTCITHVRRYDDLKSAQDNIDLQSTILSRFDLIFIVKDPATEERDAAIARKVSGSACVCGKGERERGWGVCIVQAHAKAGCVVCLPKEGRE
jgi:hypothetical protein